MVGKNPKVETKSEPETSFIEPTYQDDWGDIKDTPNWQTPQWTATPRRPQEYVSTPQSSHQFDNVRDMNLDPTNLMSDEELKASFKAFADLHGELAGRYILLINSNKDVHDSTYGVTFSPHESKFRLGNVEIDFDSDNTIHLGTGHIFKGTPGIFELLFIQKPDKSKISQSDLETYKQLLQISGVHKVNYNPNGRNRSSKSHKYKTYISKLFPPTKRVRTTKFGRGLIRNNDKLYNYIYFDDPNELVNRLAVLHASKEAGNSALDPEIASIVEELRELGLIA